MNEKLQILKAAKELIIKPENWTKDCFAKTKAGCPITPISVYAYSFCLIGATRRAAYNLFNNEDKGAMSLYGIIGKANNIHDVYIFNDISDHKGVIAALDKTIAYLEKGIDQ